MKMKMVALCVAAISSGSSVAFASVASEYVMRVPTHEKLSFFSEAKTEYTEWANVGEPHSCAAWVPGFSTVLSEISYLQNRTCSQQREREKIEFKCDKFSKTCAEEKRSNIQDNLDISESRNVNTKLGEWSNSEAPYNCSAWINDLSKSGDSDGLPQVRSCDQLQIADIEHSFKGSSLFIGQSSQVIKVDENQVVPREKGSCSSLKQQDSSLKTGMYNLDDGSSVYCEMEIAGGGYLRVSENLYSNGSFSNGSGSPNESGSNDTNEIVAIANPVSGYAIKQSGDAISEYEMHPSTVANSLKGRYMGLTLWTLNPGHRLFHNRMYFSGQSPVYDNGSSGVIDQKSVNGTMWYKVRYIAKIPKDNMSSHNWYVGFGEAKTSYFTGLTHEIYER